MSRCTSFLAAPVYNLCSLLSHCLHWSVTVSHSSFMWRLPIDHLFGICIFFLNVTLCFIINRLSDSMGNSSLFHKWMVCLMPSDFQEKRVNAEVMLNICLSVLQCPRDTVVILNSEGNWGILGTRGKHRTEGFHEELGMLTWGKLLW
jgi:hypothetical protein